jgi:hypothetical protein
MPVMVVLVHILSEVLAYKYMTSQMRDVFLECDLKDERSDSKNGGDNNHPEKDPENDGEICFF